MPKHALVKSLDYKETATLGDLCRVVAGLRPGARVPLQYFTPAKRRSPVTVVLHLDWRWCAPATLGEKSVLSNLM